MRVDLFCQIVDNYGDAGIGWRLACQFVDEAKAQVTLWIDQPEFLTRWQNARGSDRGPTVRQLADASAAYQAGDVAIAVLAAKLEPTVVSRMARNQTVWIRYEHLSAEPWIDDFHRLPSHKSVPGKNGTTSQITEWFFYPGFTSNSGGLLREKALITNQQLPGAPSEQWLAATNLGSDPAMRRISVFGYPDAVLGAFVQALLDTAEPLCLLIHESLLAKIEAIGVLTKPDRHLIRAYPWLDQTEFDSLLCGCDLNLVRGEDSWIRAHWAGKPFVWQPYRQADNIHRHKLDAFLERLVGNEPASPATRSVRDLMLALSPQRAVAERKLIAPILEDYLANLPEIGQLHAHWRTSLLQQPSALQQLTSFIDDQLQ